MDTLPAAPIAPEVPVSSRKWYEIWREVWLNPGLESFWSILKDRDHSATRGLIWIAVTSLILGLASAIISVPILNNTSPQFSSSIGGGETIVTALCTAILTPIFSIITMVIITGIYHLIAKLFNGNGTWGDLVFCMSAVMAPSWIIGSVLSVVGSILSLVPVLFFLVAIVFGIIAVALFIYNIILYILAIKAAENVGTGGAIATVLIPIGVIFVLSVCCGLTLIPAIISFNTVR